jgi:hypothetical protein
LLFQFGYFPLLRKVFEEALNQTSANRVNKDELLQRMLCDMKGISPIDHKPSVAVVFRKSSHGTKDIRLQSGTRAYRQFFESVLAKGKEKDVRMVLFDAIIDGIKIPSDCSLVDLRNHHKIFERGLTKEESSGNKVLDQLRFLRKAVLYYNIVGAIGQHGGLLDILNAFGVPPSNTLRFFGVKSRKSKRSKDGWKKRTNWLLQFFHEPSANRCTWVNGIPGLLQVETIFRKAKDMNPQVKEQGLDSSNESGSATQEECPSK